MEHQDWQTVVIASKKPIVQRETFQKTEKIIEAPKKLGLSILQARQSKGITQKELANLLCINVISINKWESEKETPTNLQLSQIEKKLSIKLPRNKLVKLPDDL